jgi:hypothetical protein
MDKHRAFTLGLWIGAIVIGVISVVLLSDLESDILDIKTAAQITMDEELPDNHYRINGTVFNSNDEVVGQWVSLSEQERFGSATYYAHFPGELFFEQAGTQPAPTNQPFTEYNIEHELIDFLSGLDNARIEIQSPDGTVLFEFSK